MADPPIRSQSALELLETHAKALEEENARLRAVLAKALNCPGAHDATCSSYSTSDDDRVEHFEPEDCDCYLKGSADETKERMCKHDDGDCHADDPCDFCPVYKRMA